jgi:hypothetical protein
MVNLGGTLLASLPGQHIHTIETTPMTLTAEERSEVSRQDGRRSKGPKTPEGKKQSSMNALEHGMRGARALAMANEDPEAVAARSTSWNG